MGATGPLESEIESVWTNASARVLGHSQWVKHKTLPGRLGRLGVGLKTEVDAWGLETEGLFPIVEGQLINNPYKESISEEQGVRIRDEGLLSGLSSL